MTLIDLNDLTLKKNIFTEPECHHNGVEIDIKLDCVNC